MEPTNDLEGVLAFNGNWTQGDRDKLARMATAANVSEWTFVQNGNRPGYWGADSAGNRLLWVMAGRVRVNVEHASTVVPLLASSGIDVLESTSEAWASHEVLLSNAGGTASGGGRGSKAVDIKANKEAAAAATEVLRAAALENRTMSYGEFAEAVGTIPRNAGAVLKLFMASGEDARWAAFVVDPNTGEPSHGYSGSSPGEARDAAHRLAVLLYGSD